MATKFSLNKIIKSKNIFIVAEAGCNHEGDLETAKKIIISAAKAGADAIKFQSFTKESLFAEKTYTKILKLKEDALNQVNNIVFKNEWYKELIDLAKKNNIIFFSTPFSVQAVDILEEYNVPLYKIASCDSNNVQLLRRLSKTKKPVILSTGLATNNEINQALKILKNNEVSILHCSVEYPSNIAYLKLGRINILKNIYKKNIIGYSDHSIGYEAAVVAASCGAKIIEKHFTVNPEKKSGDHIISLDERSFEKMVSSINNAILMLGGSVAEKKEKVLTAKEKKELIYAKRGLYLKTDKKAGEKIKEEDLISLRPCVGVSAGDYDKIIGEVLKINKKAMDVLKRTDF